MKFAQQSNYTAKQAVTQYLSVKNNRFFLLDRLNATVHIRAFELSISAGNALFWYIFSRLWWLPPPITSFHNKVIPDVIVPSLCHNLLTFVFFRLDKKAVVNFSYVMAHFYGFSYPNNFLHVIFIPWVHNMVGTGIKPSACDVTILNITLKIFAYTINNFCGVRNILLYSFIV